MSSEFACAADGPGPAKSLCTSAPSLQAEACRTDFNVVGNVLRLATLGKRGRQVPPLKLSIIMAAYNEQDLIEEAVSEVLEVEYPCDIELNHY